MNLPHKLTIGWIIIALVFAFLALMATLTARSATVSCTPDPQAVCYMFLANGKPVAFSANPSAIIQQGDAMVQVACMGATGLWSPPSNPVYLVRCPRVLSYSLTSGTFSLSALLPCPGTYQAQQRASLAGFWTDIGQPFACTTGSASVSVPTDGPAQFYRLLRQP